jgi:GrpB-like predicted nucleotidyltransferase (UPF0157 family)
MNPPKALGGSSGGGLNLDIRRRQEVVRLEPKKVKLMRVVPYDDRWPDTFRMETDHLVHILEPGAISIHHIGSTSVPGLCAKPVIDILVEAPDLAAVDQAAPDLERRRYMAKGEYGIPGRRYFSRPATPSESKVHIHAFRRGSAHVERHLQFRDYLRAHPTVAARYCALKQRLAADTF